jgi:hypothetical protein
MATKVKRIEITRIAHGSFLSVAETPTTDKTFKRNATGEMTRLRA